MSLATSYRYEAMGERKGAQKAQKQQLERIKDDELRAVQEQFTSVNVDINLKSAWSEALSEVANARKLKDDERQRVVEMPIAQKATMMVRRAALKHLLADEHAMYERELHALGKAFYIKRT